MTFIWVGLGGFLGAISRYGIFVLIKNLVRLEFPLATLLVNTGGCLLMGIFAALSHRLSWHETTQSLIFSFGFLGAFTTFSAFGYETYRLLQEQHYFTALISIAANLILCILFVFAGWKIAS